MKDDLRKAEVTARRRAEALASIAQELNAGDDLVSVLRTAVESTLRVLPGDKGFLLLFEEDRQHARILFELPEGSLAGTVIGPELLPVTRQLLKDKAPLFLALEEATGVTRQWMERMEMRSGIALPLVVHGDPIGAMYVGFRAQRRPPPRSDLRFAQAVAHQAGLAVTRARAFEAEKQASVRIARVQELTAALSAARTPEEVASAVFEKGLAVFGASAATISTPCEDDQLELLASYGYPEEALSSWQRFSVRLRTPVTDACRSGEPVWVGSKAEAAARYPGPEFDVSGSQDNAWAGVPLIADGRTIGGIGLAFREPRSFHDADRHFVLSVAHTCAQALERARLHAETQRSAKMLDALFDTMPVGVLVTDASGEFTRTNEEARRLLGGVSGTAEGPVDRYELLRPDGTPFPAAELPLVRTLREGTVTRATELVVRRDGNGELRVLASAAPLVEQPGGAISGAIGVLQDVTELRQAELSVRRTEAALEQAGEMAQLGAWWIEVANHDDLLSSPRYGSAEAFRIFGFDPGQGPLPTSAFVERVRPEDRARLLETIERAMASRQPYAAEYGVVRRDGERVVAERGVGAWDEAGRLVRITGALQDVTAQRAVEQALRAADQRKNEFLGVLSHELRNPLAPIRNSIYILNHAAPGDERAARARDVIDRQAQHLTRLVDDLLDVTRIARGKVDLRRSRIDLREVARRTAEDHRGVMEGRGIVLTVETAPRPLWVVGDPVRLAQVVGNLLQNAAKFTGKGGEVSVAALAREGTAELRVRDNGVGIEPELLERIFDPFTQGAQRAAGGSEGLGLGLALVKGLVELHGGEVRAFSEGPGRGAELVVELPLAETAARRLPLREVGPAARARRVLVVDDERDAAESLAQVVELLGHQVLVAHDGPSALAAMRESRPDVVLCDLGLPGMSGYELARVARAEGIAPAQLIALSGYAQPENLSAALEAGFDRHLSKPADLAEIEQLLA